MGSKSSESSTKAERKFEKKLQFYAKVRNTVASLAAKKAISKNKKLKSRQKKLKAYDLSSLSEFLPELKAPKQCTPATDFILSCRSRKKLVLKEGNQLKAVLNHPAFQSDPLAAINQHLQSTQPLTVDKMEKKKKPNKNGKKRVKDKRRKPASGTQSMDI